MTTVGMIRVARLIVATALSWGVPLAHAQIPVTDLGSIAQAVLQLEQLRHQLETARKAYDAITGNRGFGTILHDPDLRASLPPEWRSVYDDAGSYGHGISGSVREILASINNTDKTVEEAAQDLQEDRAHQAATQKAIAMRAYSAAESRIDQIEGLIRASGATQDTQAIAELNARIGAEQALIQTDLTKLEMISMLQRAEEKLLREKTNEHFRRITSSANRGMPVF
ncbi:P-type DNA transfer protein VirB5 [Achromobacter sp. GG226]|uniref:P-type DNA transfer protein VirB5 n=1 Tax=Verticiella alkaliphila TaxID=2779529 RepID=UPI001C0D78FD|nr:P-type DNA transfer protein VirB5 [Verticiella sp. GG226]MBU4610309.1 P-type DNA transfer protein VirB5 [Verticiella sp. GG226]